jgi:hypothetical protein
VTPGTARLGLNEALFRSINERIEAGTWPASRDEVTAFRCECAALGCNLLLEMTLAEYEAVRRHPRHFLVVPGHELPGVEVVVTRTDNYLVVEKFGEAGEVAEDTDPRDDSGH